MIYLVWISIPVQADPLLNFTYLFDRTTWNQTEVASFLHVWFCSHFIGPVFGHLHSAFPGAASPVQRSVRCHSLRILESSSCDMNWRHARPRRCQSSRLRHTVRCATWHWNASQCTSVHHQIDQCIVIFSFFSFFILHNNFHISQFYKNMKNNNNISFMIRWEVLFFCFVMDGMRFGIIDTVQVGK